MARQITSPRFHHAEHKRNLWRCYPEQGTTLEELTHPLYFVNVSGIRAGDVIEAVEDDLSGMTTLLVRKADRLSVEVGVVSRTMFDERPAVEAPAEDYRVEHNAQDQWRVVRLADGEIVSKDHSSEPVAKRWLTNHRKAL